MNKELLLKEIHEICDKNKCCGYILANKNYDLISIEDVKSSKIIEYEINDLGHPDQPKYYSFGRFVNGAIDYGEYNHCLCMIVDEIQ